jgi:hypothetical protein
MAACNFSIPFTGDAEVILDKAKRAVEKQSGNFTGDLSAGQFDVSIFGQGIVGGYQVSGGNLNITISEKPFMVPCNAIENFLKSQIV